jgi:hypothetical protein
MVFKDISEEPRESIFRIEGERNRAVSFSLLVTTTHCHNAEYRNVNPKVLPYILLRFSGLVSSLGTKDRYSDNLQTRCYCFQHHVILSTKACVLTVVQNLVVKKITSLTIYVEIKGQLDATDWIFIAKLIELSSIPQTGHITHSSTPDQRPVN